MPAIHWKCQREKIAGMARSYGLAFAGMARSYGMLAQAAELLAHCHDIAAFVGLD